MCRVLSILLFTLSITYVGYSQNISGKLVDENGEGLPFATLYVENTTTGTITNQQGEFSLKLTSGQYRIVFQFVGYQKLVKEINVGGEDLNLTITLQPEIYELGELVVTADGEDPAYRVIREAIKKRKVHQQEVNAFSCDVYIKGVQTITDKPDRFLGFKITLDTGIVYLSESVSKLYFARPDKIREEMISSKVSGRNNAFSYNQASDILFNPYENLFKYEGISERGFVSPIANNALLFYDYQLEGTISEDSLLINKIKVIGKRKTDPVFNGYIYIIEDQWRIHSVDLLLTKSNQVNFVDSLKVNQVYAPVPGNVWMLLSQKFTFDLNAFGFVGYGTFIGVHSNYEVEPNYEVFDETDSTENSLSANLFSNERKFFSNEILSVQEGANERDSTYWNNIRPVPLTEVEKKDYKEKDSLSIVKESKAYLDSVDRETNKPGITSLFLTGYLNSQSYKERFFRFEPLIRVFQYNTVEGAVANLTVAYTQRKEKMVKFQLIPTIRYGFGNERLNVSSKFFYYTNFKNYERFGIDAGRSVNQFNEANPISPEINTFETLVNRRNFIKLYSKTFLSFLYRRELVNGLLFNGKVTYAEREHLQNTADYSIFDEGERNFTSNYPNNLLDTANSFRTHQSLIADLSFRIRFQQKYISRPDRKIIQGSKYPEVLVNLQTGVPTLGSDVSFSKFSVQLSDQMNFGLAGKGRYALSGGSFITKKDAFLIDFQHFSTNRSFFTQYGLDKFQLLDYYTFSTNKGYFEAHYEHAFNGFIFNKLPLFKLTKIQTVGSVRTLYTPDSSLYLEYGFGLEHIFKVIRVGYYQGILDGKFYRSGFRIGFGF